MPLPLIRTSLLFLAIIPVILCSCKKDHEGYSFDSFNVGIDVRVNDLEITSQGDLIVCGGDRDVRGCFMRSTDNGQTWSLQEGGSFQSVYSLHMLDDLHGWAGGGFLNLWRTSDGGITWENDWIGKDVPFDENERPAITKFQFLSDSVFFFVGGENYSKGVVYYTEDNGQSFEFQFYHNQIKGIHMDDSQNGMVCGHGRVLTTTTGMNGWQDSEMQNDFYTGLVSYDSHDIITTSTGKILKSNDGGNTWEKVLEGNNWFSWKTSFNDMVSFGETVVAVGNDGYFAVSDDEGLTWTTYELNEPVELLSVFIEEQTIWCTSTNGNVIRFNLP